MSLLNRQQQAIVSQVFGSVLVLAPVGTGKTRVLAERAINAVAHDIPPEKILCLTFTNRAAQEMRDRLTAYSYEASRKATVKTFHALCAYMLRVEARRIGLPSDFVIYDEQDSLELIKEIFFTRDEKEAKDIQAKVSDCKIKAEPDCLSLACPPQLLFARLGTYRSERATAYQHTLQQRHALDFSDLIYYVRCMLSDDETIHRRWAERYDFVQVDEVQDTHMSEYEILRTLAMRSGNVAMIGDIDQTIYGWRGSEPHRVMARYMREFSPTEYSLVENYRATQTLLAAADSFANSFSTRMTRITPARICPPGEPIRVFRGRNEYEEARWIGSQIRALSHGKHEFRFDRIAILTRVHNRCSVIYNVLENEFPEIPCITVEQFEFFRRQEVKDALAYLRLLVNPYDGGAMQRMLLRPARGIGDATINNVSSEGEQCALRLIDMVLPSTMLMGDPFAELLDAYSNGQIVVFDTETTGLDMSRDEIVEVAATKLYRGQPIGIFHEFIRNTVPVGHSQNIHGYSDEELRAKGRPAHQVLAEFLEFSADAILVGHNVDYDIKMVSAHARRVGLDVGRVKHADTMNIAQRLIDAERYTLEFLARQIGLPAQPTHKADDDVRTTVDLLNFLIPKLAAGQIARMRIVGRYGKNFAPLAAQFEAWKEAIAVLRPHNLLKHVLEESGLLQHYRRDPKRIQHLKSLHRLFREHDDSTLHSETALRSLVDFAALARNLDHLSATDNQVVIVTIFQSKGLEFDAVFIAGASEDEIPHYYSQTGERLEEERRLFYVAMTRAKRLLLISNYVIGPRGYSKPPSRFIGAIGRRWLVEY